MHENEAPPPGVGDHSRTPLRGGRFRGGAGRFGERFSPGARGRFGGSLGGASRGGHASSSQARLFGSGPEAVEYERDDKEQDVWKVCA